MEIKVVVTGLEDLANSIAQLAAAMSGRGTVGVVPIDLKKVESQMTESKEEKPAPPKQDKPAPPKQEKPKAEPAPEVEPEETEPERTDETTYTYAEVRAKLGELSDAGKAAEVRSLITKYSHVGKLSAIEPKDYNALMAEAGTL